VVYFLHNQIRRIGYEEIHRDTYRRRTRSSWRTHFQWQAQITKDNRWADSAWGAKLFSLNKVTLFGRDK